MDSALWYIDVNNKTLKCKNNAKSKSVSVLFKTALTIIKYMATFSFMFPSRSQFLYLLRHFFQLCCHSLSNLQEHFLKHEYRQQVKELGRGGRRITDEGKAELCHCQLGGEKCLGCN